MSDEHPPRFLTEPHVLLGEIVGQAAPELPSNTVEKVLDDVVPKRARQRTLAQALHADPALLTTGRPNGPHAIEKLIRALRAAGATGVVLPRCADCHDTKPLSNLDEHGQRICSGCFTRAHETRARCTRCGARRRVSFRDQRNRPRCRLCPPDAGRDHTAALITHLQQASPNADAELLRTVIDQTIPQPFQRRDVCWELDRCPELLTGQAAHGSPRLVALVDTLVSHNVPGVVASSCPFCQRTLRLQFRRDRLRCCRSCYDESRATECTRCGQRQPVATRDPRGRPLCVSCMRADPVNHESCTRCQQVKLIAHRGGEQALCWACWRGEHAVCSICQRYKPCHFADTDAPRCEYCSRVLLGKQACALCGQIRIVQARDTAGAPLCQPCAQRREPCCRCGRTMKVTARLPEGPLCRTCYKTEPAFSQHCVQCGRFERLHHHGFCERCACPGVLHALLAGPDGTMRAELEPVFDALVANNPARLLVWLREPGPRHVVSALATSSGPVTHDLLDTLSPNKAARYLRAILVTAGVLHYRDEYLARLTHWLDTKTADIVDPDERRLVRTYATWTHLRRLRRVSARAPITYGQLSGVRTDIANVTALLAWLREHGLSLATCTQHDIDAWLATRNNTRSPARNFLKWAVTQHAATNVEIPHRDNPRRTEVLPETDQRWTLVRRLLHDGTLDDGTRLAGLLVLLYAQPLSRIAVLTTAHVTHTEAGEVLLTIGARPLELPHPVDDLVTNLSQNRQGHAVIGHTDNHPWLFPGGTPGRHIHPSGLQRRLRKQLDLPARVGRNTALIDLAAQLPAAVISQLLDLHITTATLWTQQAGNTHASYAADLAQRHR